MPVQGLTIALTTNPTLIAGPSNGQRQVFIRNLNTLAVYLGGPTVTTGGYSLGSSGDFVLLPLQPIDVLYGTSTGSLTVSVLRINDTT